MRARPTLVLLDRDGVINLDRPDSVKSRGELMLIPGSAAAIARLNRAGIKVAVATNQSVVGKGLISEKDLEDIHTHMKERLKKDGAHLDLILYAPDPPERPTHRRKPGPGMVKEALAHFKCAAPSALMIGDDIGDVVAAKSAGVEGWLVRTGKGKQAEGLLQPQHKPVSIYNDLSQAVDFLLNLKAGAGNS